MRRRAEDEGGGRGRGKGVGVRAADSGGRRRGGEECGEVGRSLKKCGGAWRSGDEVKRRKDIPRFSQPSLPNGNGPIPSCSRGARPRSRALRHNRHARRSYLRSKRAPTLRTAVRCSAPPVRYRKNPVQYRQNPVQYRKNVVLYQARLVQYQVHFGRARMCKITLQTQTWYDTKRVWYNTRFVRYCTGFFRYGT